MRPHERRSVSAAAPWKPGTALATVCLRDGGCCESAMRVAASLVACFRGLLRRGGGLRRRKPRSSWGNPATLLLALATARPLLPAGMEPGRHYLPKFASTCPRTPGCGLGMLGG